MESQNTKEISKTLRRKELQELRVRLLEKSDWMCSYCGIQLDEKSVRIDHIHAKSLGGSHDEDNLAACCHSCNSSKTVKSLSEWKTALLRSSSRHIEKSIETLESLDSTYFLDSEEVIAAYKVLHQSIEAIGKIHIRFMAEIVEELS